MTADSNTTPPTAHQIISAREILTNPDQFCDIPSLFQTSWGTLKAARGQTVDFNRICAPAHQSEPASGIISRIRSYAHAKGYPLRPAHSLRASAKG